MTNAEIVVYALYLKGGASQAVHTEDVAIKCFQLAPDAFSWIKHPNYPDKDIARVALVHAREHRSGVLVEGRTGKGKGLTSRTSAGPSLDGWRLTEAGLAWILKNEQRLMSKLKHRQPKTHRQELLRRLSRVRNHDLFLAFKDQPEGFSPSMGGLGDLLRCRVDAEKTVWEKRFTILRNQAHMAKQDDLLAFLDICQAHVASHA